MGRGAYVILNGALLRREEARVSADDLGFLQGDGVFETLRLYDGLAFLLAEHLERLFASLRFVCIESPWSRERLAAQVQLLVERNDLRAGSGRLRLTVTRGLGAAGEPTVLVTADPWDPPAANLYELGVEVETSRYARRPHPLQRVKSTSYAASHALRREAGSADVFEVLQWNDREHLAEGSFTNVFVVGADGVLRTPHAEDGCLEGVTRNAVLRLAAASGIDGRQGGIGRDEVAGAREIFLTGSLVEIVPVRLLDGRKVAEAVPGRITRTLHAAYRNLVAGTVERAHRSPTGFV